MIPGYKTETATAEYSGGSFTYSGFGHDQVIQVVTGSVCCFYGNGFIPLKATILQQDCGGYLRLLAGAAADGNADTTVIMDAPADGEGVLVAGAVFIQGEVHGNGLILCFFVFPISYIVRKSRNIFVYRRFAGWISSQGFFCIVYIAGAKQKNDTNR